MLKLLENSGNCWKIVEIVGKYWKWLENSAHYWKMLKFLENSGNCWKTNVGWQMNGQLANYGNSGKYWKLPANILEIIGKNIGNCEPTVTAGMLFLPPCSLISTIFRFFTGCAIFCKSASGVKYSSSTSSTTNLIPTCSNLIIIWPYSTLNIFNISRKISPPSPAKLAAAGFGIRFNFHKSRQH